jgi:hypothetical protein
MKDHSAIFPTEVGFLGKVSLHAFKWYGNISEVGEWSQPIGIFSHSSWNAGSHSTVQLII